jgi:hypothetical protein
LPTFLERFSFDRGLAQQAPARRLQAYEQTLFGDGFKVEASGVWIEAKSLRSAPKASRISDGIPRGL